VNLDSPDTWRWIWFVMAAIFLLGEMASPASFFFLPFGIGAAAAGLMCVFGMAAVLAWVGFIVVSVIAFAGFWRLGRKFDAIDTEQEGVGATRWVGQEATVIEAIPEGGIGAVRLEREEWRAESLTGAPLEVGCTVIVSRIVGVRLVVVPVDQASGNTQSRFTKPKPGAS
jgi:membrane protein implicated in regulation of membrane protease activity